MSAAFLTVPKLPDVFCDKTVRPCEPVSVNCLPNLRNSTDSLDVTQINETIEATKLQPLSQDSMEQQTVSKEACKSSLNFMKAALAQEFHSYIKNANHSIENLTDNGDLETCDGQLLLMHLSMFCPRMGGGGGGGGQPHGNLTVSGFQM